MSMELGHRVEAMTGGKKFQGGALRSEDLDDVLEGATHRSGVWKILEVSTCSSHRLPKRWDPHVSPPSGLAAGPAVADNVLANRRPRLEKRGHIGTPCLAAPGSPVTSAGEDARVHLLDTGGPVAHGPCGTALSRLRPGQPPAGTGLGPGEVRGSCRPEEPPVRHRLLG